MRDTGAMRIWVGTSGYAYKEWKGPFYPDKLPAAGFLRFYADQFQTVEINNTFYRMPTEKLVSSWGAQVPSGFAFAIKAPQRITHMARLVNVADLLEAFVRAVDALGPSLGPLLFQLPPFFRKDVPRLAEFLALVPARFKVAFEFRHASWFDDEVWAALRAHPAALCVAEGEALQAPLVATADWGYVRLRRDAYPDDLLSDWAAKILDQPWQQAFVYLKHDEGAAPDAAQRLMRALETRASAHVR